MEPFNWVSTGSITKFNRAVFELKAAKADLTEEVIKELYLKKGGLVIGDSSTQRGVEEGEVAFASLPEAEREAIVSETKAKKGKK